MHPVHFPLGSATVSCDTRSHTLPTLSVHFVCCLSFIMVELVAIYCRSYTEQSAVGHSEEAGPSAVRDNSSSGSEEELENPNFNILNNSLVQIYMSEGDATDVGVAQVDVIEENVRTDGDDDIRNTLMSCDDHVICTEKSSRDSCDCPFSHSSNQPPETDKSCEDPPAHLESADSAVVVARDDDSSSSLVKKVSFSVPEVTSHHDYVASEECKMRKIKRRKNRRHDDESSKSKRKKTSEEPNPSDHVKQVNSSGQLVHLRHLMVLCHSLCTDLCVLYN